MPPVKQLAFKWLREKYKDPIVFRAFINYASDECLGQGFDIPLVNRPSKSHPIKGLLSSGIHETSQITTDRIRPRPAVILSVYLHCPQQLSCQYIYTVPCVAIGGEGSWVCSALWSILYCDRNSRDCVNSVDEKLAQSTGIHIRDLSR